MQCRKSHTFAIFFRASGFLLQDVSKIFLNLYRFLKHVSFIIYIHTNGKKYVPVTESHIYIVILTKYVHNRNTYLLDLYSSIRQSKFNREQCQVTS